MGIAGGFPMRLVVTWQSSEMAKKEDLQMTKLWLLPLSVVRKWAVKAERSGRKVKVMRMMLMKVNFRNRHIFSAFS